MMVTLVIEEVDQVEEVVALGQAVDNLRVLGQAG